MQNNFLLCFYPKMRVSMEDEDKIICCLAYPVGKDSTIPGLPGAATTKMPVINGPGKCPYHVRHELFTSNKFYEENSDKVRKDLNCQ